MFMGSAEVKVDEKGRFVIPVKWRSSFEGGAVITQGADHCLHVWPAADFASVAADLRGDAVSLRLLMATAHQEMPDGAGRVGLPKGLRTFAAIGKDARLTGNFERLELWDEATWVAWSTAAAERLVPAPDKPELVPS